MSNADANMEAAAPGRHTLDEAPRITRPRRGTVGALSVVSDAGTAHTSNTATTATSSQRKVRTVPPSAVFEPPTPPPESQPTFDTAQRKRLVSPKRRRRVRYESSDTSSFSADNDTDDDDPPWWTFTQRGMDKLRSVRERAAHAASYVSTQRGSLSGEPGRDGADGTDHESGRESGPDGGYMRRAPRPPRRPQATPPTRGDSTGSTQSMRTAGTRLFHPLPFRATPQSFLRRGSSEIQTPVTEPPSAAALPGGDGAPLSRVHITRSNSAPIPHDPGSMNGGGDLSALPIVRVASPEPASGDPSENDVTPTGSRRGSANASWTRPRPRRQFTMPMRSTTDGNLTDSEAVGSPRYRTRPRFLRPRSIHGSVPEEGGGGDLSDADGNGSATPGIRGRLNAQNLRIRLPPPITSHFANGWPHAGSWQEALRHGTVEEQLAHAAKERDRSVAAGIPFGPLTAPVPSIPPPGEGGSSPSLGAGLGPPLASANALAAASAPVTGMGQTTPRPRSINGPMNGGETTDTDGGHHTPRARPGMVSRSSTDTVKAARIKAPEKRSKPRTKRSRRYRPAQVPPTPGGHFQVMTEKHVIGSDTWGTNEAPASGIDPETNPFDRVNPFDRIDEEYDLSPHQSSVDEKTTAGCLGCFSLCVWSNRGHVDEWRTRYRRMMFLDARVTIYIRLFNLGVVVTLLALSVTIRNKLTGMGLYGVIGPSTTLIIAYSSLTILHVLTAIYREYFGRPIGLWGLRSKMLWVCLDLLFVALWSSAATLAVNDYINTPLDCTPLAPWWTPGFDYYSTTSDSGTNATAMVAAHLPSIRTIDAEIPVTLKDTSQVHDVCSRQIAAFSISLVALVIYAVNMVLSLFRIFETVRRTANPERTRDLYGARV